MQDCLFLLVGFKASVLYVTSNNIKDSLDCDEKKAMDKMDNVNFGY